MKVEYYQAAASEDSVKTHTPIHEQEYSHEKMVLDLTLDRKDDLKRDFFSDLDLIILYFLSYLSLVCVTHFSKIYFLEAGLSVLQISSIQCFFYLSMYSGSTIIINTEHWLVTTRRGRDNVIMDHLKSIMMISIVISTLLWVAIPLVVHPDNFAIVFFLVTFGTLAISTSHGFMDFIAEDTIVNNHDRIDYHTLKFYGLCAWVFGSLGIGFLMDAAGAEAAIFTFGVVQILYLIGVCVRFPQKYEHDTKEKDSSLMANLCGRQGFRITNAYIFFFLFGMINAMPDILILHVKLQYNTTGVFVGALIACMALGQMFAYLLLQCCMFKHAIYVVGILTLCYTYVRFYTWDSFTSEYAFLGTEFLQFTFITIFWSLTLPAVNEWVPFSKKKALFRDLETIWHFQSMAFGVLVYGMLYEATGASECFKGCSQNVIFILIYFCCVFCADCCISKEDKDKKEQLIKQYSERTENETRESSQRDESGHSSEKEATRPTLTSTRSKNSRNKQPESDVNVPNSPRRVNFAGVEDSASRVITIRQSTGRRISKFDHEEMRQFAEEHQDDSTSDSAAHLANHVDD